MRHTVLSYSVSRLLIILALAVALAVMLVIGLLPELMRCTTAPFGMCGG
jgi:hypothetical protein